MKPIETIDAFPLTWPEGYKRTHYPKASRFKKGTNTKSWALLRDEVRRLGGSSLIISSNMTLRRDGDPYSSQPEPKDSGVAVYFKRKGKSMCFACDAWKHVWENAYAIAMTIDAMRSIDRWGVSDMLDRVFTGFVAITEDAGRGWASILGVSQGASADEIKAAYRRTMMEKHPDKGGEDDFAAAVNEAYRRALEEVAQR